MENPLQATAGPPRPPRFGGCPRKTCWRGTRTDTGACGTGPAQCVCVSVCMHACACAYVGGELEQTRVHAVLDLPSVYV